MLVVGIEGVTSIAVTTVIVIVTTPVTKALVIARLQRGYSDSYG